jgi:hypothetical protein
VRNAALALEHTRRMAFEVAQEQYLMAACETGAEDARQDDEREFAKRNPKFGSVMKH